MAILGGWSAANLAGGTTGYLLSDTPEGRAFHGTNAAWNTVNASIALAGAASLPKRRSTLLPPEDIAKRHRALRRTLAVNIGLDFAYIGTGAALWALGGETDNGIQLRQVGQSLTLQGGFLLGFDAAFLASHHRKAR